MSSMDRRAARFAMLLGSPRSGTTWLAKIMDSDPTVLYRHEPDSINVRPDIPFVPEKKDIAFNIELTREYLDILQMERAVKSSGSQPMFRKDYRGTTAEGLRCLVILGVKGGERILGNSSFLSRWQIPDLANQTAKSNQTVFIKSVSSLCRAYMFSQAYPELNIIHILRHPCAYVASTVRGKKLGLLSDDAYIDTLAGMPEASAYGFTLDKLSAMSRVEQLAARWMLQNSKVIQEMEGNPRYRQVIYEDLCNDPRGVAEALFEFLGLEMTGQTYDFIEQSSGGEARKNRYFDIKRDSAKAATSWKSELAGEQIDSIRRVVSRSSAGRLYFTK